MPKDQITPQALGCGNQGGAGPRSSVAAPPSPGDGEGAATPGPSPAERAGWRDGVPMLGPAPAPAPAPVPVAGDEFQAEQMGGPELGLS